MFRGPLRSRNFRLLLTCNIISRSGTAVAAVATPFAVLAIGGSASDVGYVAAASLVPILAFLLLGGVLGDRLPRQQIMVAASGLQAVAQGVSAVLVLSGSAAVWELALLAAVRGVGISFFSPASEGLLPETVPASQRAQANAMNGIGLNGAQIGGAAVGGVLVGLAGPGWGLAADAASFALAGALRTGMRFPRRMPAPRASLLHEMREGWRDFVSRRWLWVIVVQFAFVVAILTGTQGVLGPLVADAHLGGARGWGVIMAAFAAGAVLGGLVMIRFRPRRMLLVASLAVPANAVFLLALAVPLSVPLVAAAAFVNGGCLELFGVNWATTMQQEIRPAMLSRLSSYDALGSLALAPAGTAAAGPLAGWLGTRAVLAGGAVLIVILTAAVLAVPEVRHMQRQIHTAAREPDGVSS
jgi:MFS family permease